VSWKQTVVAALILAVVAAGLMWYMERYQGDMLVAKFHEYLRKQDDFRDRFPEGSTGE